MTAPASTLGTRAAVNFSFTRQIDTRKCPDPLGRGCVSERLDQSDRRVDCAAAAHISNASYHLSVVASDVVLDLEHSEKSSSIGRGCLCPTPFGRTSNHHSTVSDSPDMLNGGCTTLSRISRELPWISLPRRTLVLKLFRASCALRRVHVLAFLRDAFLTVGQEAFCRNMTLWSPRIPPAWSRS